MSIKPRTFERVAKGELQAKIYALETGRFPSDDIPGLQPETVARHLREFTERLARLIATGKKESLNLYEQGRTPIPSEAEVNFKHRYGAGNLLLQALLGEPDVIIYQRWENHNNLFPTAEITPETIGRFRFARVAMPARVDNMFVAYYHQNSGAHIQGGRVTQGSYAMFPSLVAIEINPQTPTLTRQ